jgi:hypothetical protein
MHSLNFIFFLKVLIILYKIQNKCNSKDRGVIDWQFRSLELHLFCILLKYSVVLKILYKQLLNSNSP